ncbi:RYamide receptor-like isoform X2 [Stylophora pistillata]|nr:RYamide receptor-like isoform X2 [Stylophora pistillata]XP_022786004.1 RYamide receptor-like isoform X2 [Stylophora pistillata]
MTLKETEVVIFTVLYAVAMLVAFSGNGFLIYIVWKKPEVRSLTSFMFVNMAIADLLVTLVVMPWSISQLYTDGLWMIPGILGKITCKFIVYTAFVTITASILCLTLMAVDRYYAIVHPFRRQLWFRKPKLTVPFIWILSLASMSIFPVVQTVEDHNSECTLSVYVLGDPFRALRGIFLFLVVVNYLIPLTVTSVIYTITAWRLWFHVAPGVEHLTGNRERLETSKRRVVKMLIIVTCTFALCWLPAQVVHMIFVMQAWNIEVTLQPIVMFVCFWFGHSNSAINPWLYIFLSSKINTAFTRIISRKSSRSPLSLSIKTSNSFLPPEDEAVQKESTL